MRRVYLCESHNCKLWSDGCWWYFLSWIIGGQYANAWLPSIPVAILCRGLKHMLHWEGKLTSGCSSYLPFHHFFSLHFAIHNWHEHVHVVRHRYHDNHFNIQWSIKITRCKLDGTYTKVKVWGNRSRWLVELWTLTYSSQGLSWLVWVQWIFSWLNCFQLCFFIVQLTRKLLAAAGCLNGQVFILQVN